MTVMPVDGLRNPRDLDLVETPPPPNSKPLLPPLFWAIRSRSHGFLLDLSAPKKGKHSKPLPPPTSKPRPHRHQPQQQQCDVHESSYRQSIEVIERSRNEPAPEERSAVAGQRHASARQQQVRIDARRSALDRGQRRQMAGVTCVTTEHTKTKKKTAKKKVHQLPFQVLRGGQADPHWSSLGDQSYANLLFNQKSRWTVDPLRPQRHSTSIKVEHDRISSRTHDDTRAIYREIFQRPSRSLARPIRRAQYVT